MTFAVDVGKIRFQWQGDYDETATYEANDVVNYQGSSWICTVPPNLDGSLGEITGVEPTPGVNWNVMASGSNIGLTNIRSGTMFYWNDVGRVLVPITPPTIPTGQRYQIQFTAPGQTVQWEKVLRPRRRNITRTDFSGAITTSSETLLTYDLANVFTSVFGDPLSGPLPSTVYALQIGVYYRHSGGADHGYCTGDFYQEGDDVNRTHYASSHYNDYYNTDWTILEVPWSTSFGTVLNFSPIDMHNTNSSNQYYFSLCGYLYEV